MTVPNSEMRNTATAWLRRAHALANFALAACAAVTVVALVSTGAATSRFGFVLLMLLVPGGLFCAYGAFTALAGRISAVAATVLGTGAGGIASFLVFRLGEGMSK